MDIWEVLETCANDKCIPVYKIGIELGKTKNYMSGQKARGTIPSVENYARMLSVCGYSLIVVRDDEVPSDSMRITFE